MRLPPPLRVVRAGVKVRRKQLRSQASKKKRAKDRMLKQLEKACLCNLEHLTTSSLRRRVKALAKAKKAAEGGHSA
jgi:hypothetical protein